MVQAVVPVDGPVVGLVGGPVGGPVGCPVIDLVGKPVGDLVGGLFVGLAGGPVCCPVGAVCGPSRCGRWSGGPVGCSVVPYSGRPASKCLDIWVLHALVLRWCCGSSAVVRSVVLVDGAVGGPVGGMVQGPAGGLVSGPVGGLVCGLVDGPVCGLVRAACGLSKHVLLHTMACQLKCLDIGRKGLVFFWNLCNSQKPGPGSAHTLPTKCGPRCFMAQLVGGPRRSTRQLFQNLHSYKPSFLDTMVILGSTRVCASVSWSLKRS